MLRSNNFGKSGVLFLLCSVLLGISSCKRDQSKGPGNPLPVCSSSTVESLQFAEIYDKSQKKVCTGVFLNQQVFISSALCFSDKGFDGKAESAPAWSDFSVQWKQERLTLSGKSRLLPHKLWASDDGRPSFIVQGLPLAFGVIEGCVPDVREPQWLDNKLGLATVDDPTAVVLRNAKIATESMSLRPSRGYLIEEEMHFGTQKQSGFACPWADLAGIFAGNNGVSDQLLAIPFLPFTYDKACTDSDGYRFIAVDAAIIRQGLDLLAL